MKLSVHADGRLSGGPAAFRRLCVETGILPLYQVAYLPAAFRRLCVETKSRKDCWWYASQPPSGGCVLKLFLGALNWIGFGQPPSGGCVLKLVSRIRDIN